MTWRLLGYGDDGKEVWHVNPPPLVIADKIELAGPPPTGDLPLIRGSYDRTPEPDMTTTDADTMCDYNRDSRTMVPGCTGPRYLTLVMGCAGEHIARVDLCLAHAVRLMRAVENWPAVRITCRACDHASTYQIEMIEWHGHERVGHITDAVTMYRRRFADLHGAPQPPPARDVL